jgi:YgiT-type zinc finger domain-containing protein
MICDICGKEGAKIRKITESHGKGDNILIIEDVPVISCSHCGESYLTADTLHEIECIKSHRAELAVRRSVEVANFV